MTQEEKDVLKIIRDSTNPNALEIAIQLALNLLKQA